MNEKSYYEKIHLLGRVTVIMALASFIAVPFVLAMANGMSIDVPHVLQNGTPILLTFTIAAVCENLSYMPIIGSGALYMACVTGNVTNMKIPAAANAMEIAGYTPGSDQGDVISMIAVACSTFVTTAIVFCGMLFLAPIFAPIYNNEFLNPAFQNMIPALMGALLAPRIIRTPKQAIVPLVLPCIAIFTFGRAVFSKNQSYIMIVVIICSCLYSYWLHKKKMI